MARATTAGSCAWTVSPARRCGACWSPSSIALREAGGPAGGRAVRAARHARRLRRLRHEPAPDRRPHVGGGGPARVLGGRPGVCRQRRVRRGRGDARAAVRRPVPRRRAAAARLHHPVPVPPGDAGFRLRAGDLRDREPAAEAVRDREGRRRHDRPVRASARAPRATRAGRRSRSAPVALVLLFAPSASRRGCPAGWSCWCSGSPSARVLDLSAHGVKIGREGAEPACPAPAARHRRWSTWARCWPSAAGHDARHLQRVARRRGRPSPRSTATSSTRARR